MKIIDAEVMALRIPLKHAFTIALGTLTHSNPVLVRLAALDHVARASARPLHRLIGKQRVERVPVIAALGIISPDEAAQIYFYTATPNIISALEMGPWHYVDDVVTDPVAVENGCVDIPDSNGLGVTIDEDKVAHYRIDL